MLILHVPVDNRINGSLKAVKYGINAAELSCNPQPAGMALLIVPATSVVEIRGANFFPAEK